MGSKSSHQNWEEKNRDHFNSTASTYNTQFSESIQQLSDAIQARRSWISSHWIEDSGSESSPESSSTADVRNDEKSVRLLDYACGTGLISRTLAPYTSSCLGLDISTSMVNEYNKAAQNQGLSPAEMHAELGSLTSTSPAEISRFEGADYRDFDIAAVGMALHHMEDPALAIQKLSERLNSNGVLFVVDFMPHEGHPHNHNHNHHGHSHGRGGNDEEKDQNSHSAAHTVTHNGFSEIQIKNMFEEAGVGKDFKHVRLGKGVIIGNKEARREVFIARGSRV